MSIFSCGMCLKCLLIPDLDEFWGKMDTSALLFAPHSTKTTMNPVYSHLSSFLVFQLPRLPETADPPSKELFPFRSNTQIQFPCSSLSIFLKESEGKTHKTGSAKDNRLFLNYNGCSVLWNFRGGPSIELLPDSGLLFTASCSINSKTLACKFSLTRHFLSL